MMQFGFSVKHFKQQTEPMQFEQNGQSLIVVDVIYRLGLAMIDLNIEFEVSMFTPVLRKTTNNVEIWVVWWLEVT